MDTPNSMRSSTASAMIRRVPASIESFAGNTASVVLRSSNHLLSSVYRSEDGSIEIFWDHKLLVGKDIKEI